MFVYLVCYSGGSCSPGFDSNFNLKLSCHSLALSLLLRVLIERILYPYLFQLHVSIVCSDVSALILFVQIVYTAHVFLTCKRYSAELPMVAFLVYMQYMLRYCCVLFLSFSLEEAECHFSSVERKWMRSILCWFDKLYVFFLLILSVLLSSSSLPLLIMCILLSKYWPKRRETILNRTEQRKKRTQKMTALNRKMYKMYKRIICV